MKRTLQYNEFGAPIQANPKWCDLISRIFRKVSGLFYPKHMAIYLWFQSEAYAWGDIQCYSGNKGYEK